MTSLSDRVDAPFAKWDRPDSPGCALGVIQGGRLVYSRGYGAANLDYGIPITPDSVFYIASTSKQFTAACIALLAQRDTIGLDDDVRQYVPEIPAYGSTITIRHLVHHISGLRDYLSLMELAGRSFEDFFDLPEAIEILSRQRGSNFAPGAEYLYCNSGYALMAEIVRRASGQTLRQFAEAHIFQPLGMGHTHFDDDCKAVAKNRVVSYRPADGGGFRHYLKNFNGVGSGGLLTTVHDLYRWDQSFYERSVGGEQFYAWMLTRGELVSGQTIPYAFGLIHGEHKGLKTVSHAGGMLGFRTEMVRFPEERFSVICLANLDAINARGLALQVADLYLADRFSPDAPAQCSYLELSPEALEEYAGVYRGPTSGLTVELFVQDGGLVVEAGGRSFALSPLSEARFRAADALVDLELQFVRQGGGGRYVAQIQLPGRDTAQLEPMAVATPSAEELSEYVGSYLSDELQTLYEITLDAKEGRLNARRGRAPIETLKPGSRDIFRLPFATLHFNRDDGGVVKGCTVCSGRVRGIDLIRK